MAVQHILLGAGALLAALGSARAHAIGVKANKGLDVRHDDTCKPTATVTCTVIEKEIVTVREYYTVTATGAAACNATISYSATTLPTSTVTTSSSSSSSVSSSVSSSNPSSSSASSTTSTSSTSSAASSTPTICPAPVSCDNLGFDWAYYNNTARNTDETYSAFRPDTFKTAPPLYVGTSNYVGGLYSAEDGTQSRTGPIYGSTVRNLKLDFFALNHHAYIYACEAGTYKVDIPYANDAVYLWVGAKAYAGWADGNADAKARYNQPDHIAGRASFAFDVPADTYVPIRFVYGQAQYGGGFNFNVTAPSGQVIVSDAASDSPYVVRRSCDGVLAPAYPPFGAEI